MIEKRDNCFHFTLARGKLIIYDISRPETNDALYSSLQDWRRISEHIYQLYTRNLYFVAALFHLL